MKAGRWTGLGILLAMPLLLGVQCHPEELGPVSSAGYVSPFAGPMVRVPTGAFQRDEAVTNVTAVTAFFVSRYPITQERYTMVTGANPSYFRHDEDSYDRPVESVSWYDAIVFCNLLSEIEGRTPAYTILGSANPEEWGPVPRNGPDPDWDAVTMNMEADGYRLPTEAEWMWAAMGATTGAGYPGIGTFRTGWRKEFAGDPNPTRSGDPIDDYAWYGYISDPQGTATEERTYQVGLKLPSELGLYDMSGNVWEWTWDWLGPYPDGPLTDPAGAPTGTNRVSRGGSWYDAASVQSVAFRGSFQPITRGNRHGTFRVVTR